MRLWELFGEPNREQLDELFSQPAPYKWKRDGNAWVANFKIGDKPFEAYFALEYFGGKKYYNFGFEYLGDDSAAGDDTHGNTGLGNEFAVFATVIAILKEFLTKQKPDAVEFSGDKSDGKSRLYDQMVRKMAKQAEALGYVVNQGMDDSRSKYYRIEKHVTESEQLTELFNKPAAYTWGTLAKGSRGGHPIHTAKFAVGDLQYTAYFDNDELNEPNEWDFVFQFNGSNDGRLSKSKSHIGDTGLGGEFEVFATVLAIMKEFIAKYHPTAINFSGDNKNGRGKLYTFMAKRLGKELRSLGYETSSVSQMGAQHFTLTKINEDGRIVKGVNTTCDVGMDEITRQAAKFGNKVSRDGRPVPTIIEWGMPQGMTPYIRKEFGKRKAPVDQQALKAALNDMAPSIAWTGVKSAEGKALITKYAQKYGVPEEELLQAITPEVLRNWQRHFG